MATSSSPDRILPFGPDRAMAWWLFACSAGVFAMVVIGGVTRLTESGLSMVEWRPLYGFLPPLDTAEWERVFALYRASPQFQLVNASMTLADFKGIFWWEYIHRVWGRALGLIVAVPFIWFVTRRRIGWPLGRRLVAIFILGGLQGFLGWYMVKSGLVDRPEVSQYRLTAHLALAVVLYAALLWTGFDLGREPARENPATAAPAGGLRAWVWILAGLVAVTILAGGFMAGTDAGRTYNTYPLMDGRLLPAGYFGLGPWFTAPFETVTAINFNHRWLGTATLLLALGVAAATHRFEGVRRTAGGVLVAVVLGQFVLGLATLLKAVPVPLAAAHQAGALLLFTIVLWLAYLLRRSRS